MPGLGPSERPSSISTQPKQGRGPHHHVEVAIDWCNQLLVPFQSQSNFFGGHLHASSLKAKVFPSTQGLTVYLFSSWGPSNESFSLLCKAFLWALFANITKLERLHRAVSRAISGSLSASPIPLFLSEVL